MSLFGHTIGHCSQHKFLIHLMFFPIPESQTQTALGNDKQHLTTDSKSNVSWYPYLFSYSDTLRGRSQWPRGLRRRCTDA
jgi:hypothetical protein